jgi:hypothetical protein
MATFGQGTHASHAAAETVHSGRPTRGLTQELGRLQGRVDAAYRAAMEEFANPLVGDDVPENPLLSARAEWQSRIGRCSDDGCRQSLLIDELNRLGFPFGTGPQQIAHIPWPTGSFRIEYRDGRGSLEILPIIDDLIVIRAATSERRNASWMCDLTAYGRLRPDGSASMKAIGDEIRFTLTTERRGAIRLGAIGPEPNRPAGCPGRGSLWGTYRPHFLR